jgi:hypothetical protein
LPFGALILHVFFPLIPHQTPRLGNSLFTFWLWLAYLTPIGPSLMRFAFRV